MATYFCLSMERKANVQTDKVRKPEIVLSFKNRIDIFLWPFSSLSMMPPVGALTLLPFDR